jgi:hypothetical protein
MATRKIKKAAATAKNVLEAAIATLPVKKKTVRARKPKAAVVKESARTTATAAAQSAVPSPELYILIDYPVDNETVSGLHYAIRVGASDAGFVELSFDGGDWQTCRAAAGYWWFDWGYFSPGTHKIVARLCDQDGKTLKKSSPVTVTVI